MRILELFSGPGSVGNVCRRLGCTVTSLDRDLPADIQMDILGITALHRIQQSKDHRNSEA